MWVSPPLSSAWVAETSRPLHPLPRTGVAPWQVAPSLATGRAELLLRKAAQEMISRLPAPGYLGPSFSCLLMMDAHCVQTQPAALWAAVDDIGPSGWSDVWALHLSARGGPFFSHLHLRAPSLTCFAKYAALEKLPAALQGHAGPPRAAASHQGPRRGLLRAQAVTQVEAPGKSSCCGSCGLSLKTV